MLFQERILNWPYWARALTGLIGVGLVTRTLAYLPFAIFGLWVTNIVQPGLILIETVLLAVPSAFGLIKGKYLLPNLLLGLAICAWVGVLMTAFTPRSNWQFWYPVPILIVILVAMNTVLMTKWHRFANLDRSSTKTAQKS